MYLTAADIEAVADVIYKAALEAKTPAQFKKVSAKNLEAADKGRRSSNHPDIALFGRMVTSNAFRECRVVDPMCPCNLHPSDDVTSSIFTPPSDDFEKPGESEEDRGADMMGDIEFTSACFYKYFSIDVDGIVENLTAQGIECGCRPRRRGRWPNATVIAFLEAAVYTSPSGKQNTFAAHQLPDAILVEVKSRKDPRKLCQRFRESRQVCARRKDL